MRKKKSLTDWQDVEQVRLVVWLCSACNAIDFGRIGDLFLGLQ